MGLWDGLSFREIKERFPELYERRGVDMSVPIPGRGGAAGGALPL